MASGDPRQCRYQNRRSGKQGEPAGKIARVDMALKAGLARLDIRIGRLHTKVELTRRDVPSTARLLVADVAGLLFAALHVWAPH
jgi:hypothetical protein